MCILQNWKTGYPEAFCADRTHTIYVIFQSAGIDRGSQVISGLDFVWYRSDARQDELRPSLMSCLISRVTDFRLTSVFHRKRPSRAMTRNEGSVFIQYFLPMHRLYVVDPHQTMMMSMHF